MVSASSPRPEMQPSVSQPVNNHLSVPRCSAQTSLLFVDS
jgi:hypothetical protein